MTPALAVNLGALVSVLVVLGAIAREFRERAVDAETLWIRPALLGILTLALTGASLELAPQAAPLLALYVLAGLAAGALVGVLVARSTAIGAAGNPRRAQVRGSAATIAIWAVVLVARLAARFAFPSQPPILGLDASVASAAVVSVAFGILAFAFRNAIRARTHSGGVAS